MRKISFVVILSIISFSIEAQSKTSNDINCTIQKNSAEKSPEFSELVKALQTLEKKLHEQQQELALIRTENSLLKEQFAKFTSTSFIFNTNRKVEVSRVGSKQGVYK